MGTQKLRDIQGRFKTSNNEVERFFIYVAKAGEDECWLWIGNTVGRGNDPRYGQFSSENGPVYAHRFSYVLHKGPIPFGLQIHHKCGVRLCVNPAHLEPKTAKQHMSEHLPSHCKHGHEYTPENTFIRTTGQRRCRECDRQRYETKVKPFRRR